MDKIRILVWNEFICERENPQAQTLYPEGIHTFIANFLSKNDDMSVMTATLDEPEHGLTENVLNNIDVIIWWGHKAHNEVRDTVVSRVYSRVFNGMGLIVLHSGHYSKIFRALLGTSATLKWRVAGETERIWNIKPGHPITNGIGEYIELSRTETYGERFDIPVPDDLIFISWFEGGEVFRSGCCWQCGNGRLFYFRPGHETYPIFHNELIQKVIINAVRWATHRV